MEIKLRNTSMLISARLFPKESSFNRVLQGKKEKYLECKERCIHVGIDFKYFWPILQYLNCTEKENFRLLEIPDREDGSWMRDYAHDLKLGDLVNYLDDNGYTWPRGDPRYMPVGHMARWVHGWIHHRGDKEPPPYSEEVLPSYQELFRGVDIEYELAIRESHIEYELAIRESRIGSGH